MRWVGLVVGAVIAVGCRGAIESDEPPPLVQPDGGGIGVGSAADAGSGDLGGSPDGGPGGAQTTGPQVGDAGAGGDAGDASAPLCPPLPASTGGSDRPIPDWSAPTAVPFSCAPMPNAFFFPRPGTDVPGVYARCASFADARAISLAPSRTGDRVALIGIDGVARIVDVASRTVVGVLAPPRVSVGLAAFSPSGDTIVTVARGERVVTLWRADSFKPIWTTILPGHTYQDEYPGVAAFSPDGTAVLVSPGSSLYLLDPATGRIRATNDQLGGVILGGGYGLGGLRIAVLVAPLSGMCIYVPVGGSVAILDPVTLAPIARPMVWPQTSDETPGPGRLLVAADADLIMTTGLQTDPEPPPNAFRISDGAPLPTPPFGTLPLALSPDGASALMGDGGTLDLVRLSDGASLAGTPAAAPTAAAFSADGSSVVAGSSGDNLLGIWKPANGQLVPTCAAEARVSDEPSVGVSLSGDGRTLAVDWGQKLRILRRADGAITATIDHDHQLVFGQRMSPDGRYVISEFYAAQPIGPNFPLAVFRTSDGAQVVDLGDQYAFDGGSWGPFVFLPDGRRIDSELSNKGHGVVMEIDLQTGSVASKPLVGGDGQVVGASGDCLLLLGPNATLVRSCGACQPLPVAQNTIRGVVSRDGQRYLSQEGQALVTGTDLWSIAAPAPAVIRSYPPRPEEAMWSASETPVAISMYGGRVITGASERASCSAAPGFTSRVHDVATDTALDSLPPDITSTSSDLGVIGYGPVLWCAR